VSRVHHRCYRPTAQHCWFEFNAAARLLRVDEADVSFQMH
jgi:hypothetical protein